MGDYRKQRTAEHAEVAGFENRIGKFLHGKRRGFQELIDRRMRVRQFVELEREVVTLRGRIAGNVISPFENRNHAEQFAGGSIQAPRKLRK